jgi:hypothetical protein
VLLRLVGAPPAAVQAVTADTGLRPTSGQPARPAIVVEFTDDLGLTGPVRKVGRTSGFAGEDYVVGPAPGQLCTLPLADAGGELTVRCERGVVHVPHLVSLLNLAMLGTGALPLHAAAVVHGGRGLVATGWSKGGKTEIVLGLMARGATFVADEWCYLDPEERQVLGLRHPIRVWDWQLKALPELRAKLTTKQRARLTVTGQVARGALRGPLEPTLGVSASPEQLFGADRMADTCSVDALILVEAWDDPHIESRRIEASEVSARMRASLAAERGDLTEELSRFHFAFPTAVTPALDAALEREPALLDQALDGTPAWLVSHPYPVDLTALARAVEQLV